MQEYQNLAFTLVKTVVQARDEGRSISTELEAAWEMLVEELQPAERMLASEVRWQADQQTDLRLVIEGFRRLFEGEPALGEEVKTFLAESELFREREEVPEEPEPALDIAAVVEPPVVEPTVVEPRVAESSVVEPTVVESTVAQPTVAESRVAESTVAQPTVVESPVVEPPAGLPPLPPRREPAPLAIERLPHLEEVIEREPIVLHWPLVAALVGLSLLVLLFAELSRERPSRTRVVSSERAATVIAPDSGLQVGPREPELALAPLPIPPDTSLVGRTVALLDLEAIRSEDSTRAARLDSVLHWYRRGQVSRAATASQELLRPVDSILIEPWLRVQLVGLRAALLAADEQLPEALNTEREALRFGRSTELLAETLALARVHLLLSALYLEDEQVHFARAHLRQASLLMRESPTRASSEDLAQAYLLERRLGIG